MKKYVIDILVAFFFLCGSAFAATYEVTTNGELTTALGSAVAGDIIDIHAGTYTVALNPTNSGSSGNPITIQRDSSASEWEVVISNSSTMCVYLTESKDYISYYGLYFSGCEGSWIWLNGADHVIIQDSRFYSADAYSGIVIGDYSPNVDSDYNLVKDNIFDNAPVQDSGGVWDTPPDTYCQDAWDANATFTGDAADCNRETMPSDMIRVDRGYGNVIEGNTIGRSSHDAIDITPYEDGEYNTVIKNNTINNGWHRAFDVNSKALVENNLIKNSGRYKLYNPSEREREDIDGGAISFFSEDGGIVRFNIIRDCDSGVYFGRKSAGPSLDSLIYNNTCYNNLSQIRALGNNYSGGYTGNEVLNNIFEHDGNIVSRPLNLGILPDQNFLPVINDTDVGTVTNYFAYNMWTEDDDRYYFKNTNSVARCLESGSGGSCGNGYLESLYPTEWDSSNLEGSPYFNDAANDDFTIGSSSDAIDAGGWLTTITSATGSGISFVVDDASYFYDGWSIPGEVGDVIKTASGETATIVSINYSTNTITVNSSISWTQNEGLSLDYYGSAPDIGAEEYEGGETTTVTATASDATGAEQNQDVFVYLIACSPDCNATDVLYSFPGASGAAIIDTDYNCDDEDGNITITGANATITCTPVDDDLAEGSETAYFSLNYGSGYALGTPYTADAEITDNDQNKATFKQAGTASISNQTGTAATFSQ